MNVSHELKAKKQINLHGYGNALIKIQKFLIFTDKKHIQSIFKECGAVRHIAKM